VTGLSCGLSAGEQLALALAAVTALTLRGAVYVASDPALGLFVGVLGHHDHDPST
jgi:hypothetical protein